jgi:hypothetical protein
MVFSNFRNRTLWCALILLIGAKAPVFGQTGVVQSPRTILKINPLSIFVTTFNVQVEHRLSTRFSGQVGFAVGGPTVSVYSPNLIEPIDYTLIGITPEIRYYLSFQKREVPRGPYLGTYLRFQKARKSYPVIAYDPDFFQEKETEVTYRIKSAGGGFVLGYQFFIKKRIAVDLFLGPKYSFAKAHFAIECPTCDGDERPALKPGMTFDGLDLRAGLSVGYGFN